MRMILKWPSSSNSTQRLTNSSIKIPITSLALHALIQQEIDILSFFTRISLFLYNIKTDTGDSFQCVHSTKKKQTDRQYTRSRKHVSFNHGVHCRCHHHRRCHQPREVLLRHAYDFRSDPSVQSDGVACDSRHVDGNHRFRTKLIHQQSSGMICDHREKMSNKHASICV